MSKELLWRWRGTVVEIVGRSVYVFDKGDGNRTQVVGVMLRRLKQLGGANVGDVVEFFKLSQGPVRCVVHTGDDAA